MRRSWGAFWIFLIVAAGLLWVSLVAAGGVYGYFLFYKIKRQEILKKAYEASAKGNYDLAIARYSEAIEINPGTPATYNVRGLAKRAKGDMDGAVADFNRALELDPKYVFAYYNRGLVEKARNDLSGAIADFTRAIELDPTFEKAYNNRGLAKQSRNDPDGAIADYNSAIEIDPRYAFAYWNRGLAKKTKGDLEGAVADFDRVIEFDPKDTETLLRRVTPGQTVEWYQKAADQGNPDAQYNLGVLYAEGRGVPRNGVLAYAWVNLAAESGDVTATQTRAILEKSVTLEQKAEAQKLSAELSGKIHRNR